MRERRGLAKSPGNDDARPRTARTSASNGDSLAARLEEEPEGKCSGEEGLYSRGNATLNRGFNREELGAESSGGSKRGRTG